MKIDIILPYKEIFSENKASAVSLTVKNSFEFSKFKKKIIIYGQHTNEPFYKKNFIGIKPRRLIHFGNNLSIVKQYIKLTKNNDNKKIIEIHNRPYLFNYLINKIRNIPIVIYYHNDATTMKGSKTVNERKEIIKNAAGIVFVSEFIKKQFLKGIKSRPKNIYVLPNGIKRISKKKPVKEKKVLFVGRLVEEKGAHIYVNSLVNIVKKFPDWKFIIIGTSKAGQKKLITSYEKKTVDTFLRLGKRVKYYGFLPNSKVKQIMSKSSILVVPSIWDDPFPLVALEGLATSQAVIASSRGGLIEMLNNSGILIKNIDSKKLEKKLYDLIKNRKKLLYYQNIAWKNFKYEQKIISKKQDVIRQEILNKYLVEK